MSDDYPTRGTENEILRRREMVVWGQGALAVLTPEQLTTYDQQGFLVLPGFFDAMRIEAALAAAWKEADKSLWAAADPVTGRVWSGGRSAVAGPNGVIPEPDGAMVRSIFRVH